MNTPPYRFYKQAAVTLNSAQSNAVLLYGNVHDLFYVESLGKYLPLQMFLSAKFDAKTPGTNTPIVHRVLYQQNRPIEFFDAIRAIKEAWVRWRLSQDTTNDRPKLDAKFEEALIESSVNSSVALEFLRQIASAWRHHRDANPPLLFIVDDADLVIPAGDGDIARLGEGDRRNIAIMQDWLSDPEFLGSGDNIILISESLSQIHPRISRLPQLSSIEVNQPSFEDRRFYLEITYRDKIANEEKDSEARQTAGLTIQALRQLVLDNIYENGNNTIPSKKIIAKVEQFIKGQIGEDVVEFFKPEHGLVDVVGATVLKNYLRDRFIPRIKKGGRISGATVAGPIGGGKTFIFSAVAGELGVPVLVLKGIRSQWFGQTDVIFERLRRVLESLERALIFVDEADTQGFGVGKDIHETERRLAGKMQAMMSDPKLRGKVIWLLMTARPELLSPDIRRPGRAGDLIIPVLDPENDDRIEFVRWLVKPFVEEKDLEAAVELIDPLTKRFSPASFSSIRDEAKDSDVKGIDDLVALITDTIEGDIGAQRELQTLQAMLNTTRISLLPSEFHDRSQIENNKDIWRENITTLLARLQGQ